MAASNFRAESWAEKVGKRATLAAGAASHTQDPELEMDLNATASPAPASAATVSAEGGGAGDPSIPVSDGQRGRGAEASELGIQTLERGTTLTNSAATAETWGEADAIQQAKQGYEPAFEYLYHRHKRRVYSLCLRMTGNTGDADDLAQEAFLQLFRKIDTFRGESAFSTWLHRLSVNVVLMHLRRKGLPEVSLEETTEPSQEDGPKRDIGRVDMTLVGSVDRVNLERAIQMLPPGYRTIFVLHDMEGYEHNEIAEMMKCSIGNSKSQLHKARMKLRELLKLQPRPSPRSVARSQTSGATPA